MTSRAFAMRYGALETLLAALTGGSATSIVSRFRKLRPKFAPDGLLSDTGANVSYDLTRVLAISAIFELNALSIPQGHAVELVVANWPEIARACIGALRQAAEGASARMPDRSSVVRIHIDTLSVPGGHSWASLSIDAMRGVPHVVLDCLPMVVKVIDVASRSGQAASLEQAFDELEGTFGWEELSEDDPHRLPKRTRSEFFGTGPYFERARALLEADPEREYNHRAVSRLQALLDYLEAPPPIDSWKRYIGTEPARPRLVHMLGAWGVELKLSSRSIGQVGTLGAASLDRSVALDLIARGEEYVAELAEVGGRGA